MNSSQAASRFFAKLFTFKREQFAVAALNSQLQMMSFEILFEGTINACAIHPREIFKFGLMHNAASLLISHSHPLGTATPSKEDVSLTHQILFLGQLMHMPVRDHIIIGKVESFSFADAHWIEKLNTQIQKKIDDEGWATTHFL